MDFAIVRYFGELGPAASAALPALEALLSEFEESPPARVGVPDKDMHPLDWAVWRIRGEGAGHEEQR